MKPLVIQIIDTLNTEGRPGPQNLFSDECYGWVTKKLKISRSQYNKTILSHTINDTERSHNRSAYFVRTENNQINLFKSTEEELRPFVCLCVQQINSPITSARIKSAVKDIYPFLTPVDILNQNNLRSKQQRIDQTIRNILVSNFDKTANNCLFNRSDNKPYTFSLTPTGETKAAEALSFLANEQTLLFSTPEQPTSSDQNIYSDEELENLSKQPYTQSSSTHTTSSRRNTDGKLLRTIIQKNNFRCKINSNHITFAGANGLPNFVEGHHLIPLAAQHLFPDTNLDCPANLVPLCPNCHSAIHHGTTATKETLLNQLLETYKPSLLTLGITEERLNLLLWRYYLCK